VIADMAQLQITELMNARMSGPEGKRIPKSDPIKPPRRQKERREVSDAKLMEAAIEVISRKGSSGTTMAEVGLTAGYSRGLPGERYGSKLNMLVEVIIHLRNLFRQKVEAELGDLKGLEALETRLQAHVGWARENPVALKTLYFLMMESMTVSPELRHEVTALESYYRDGIVRHLREAIEAGEISSRVDPEHYGVLILGTTRGVIQQMMVSQQNIDVRWVRDNLLRTTRILLANP
jgi:AcrR family transcriptional regulator